MQGKSWQLSLGNLSSKDGRVRFLLRDLSMCSIVKIEGNELSHPSCSLHVQRDVLGGRKSIRSLKGKFSELPVSRKKCLNYIHFLTSRDNRKEKIKPKTQPTKKFPKSTHELFYTITMSTRPRSLRLLCVCCNMASFRNRNDSKSH